MPASVTAVRPAWAIEGGRITIEGTGFPVDRPQLPGVRIGGAPARAVFASTKQIDVLLPSGLDGGQAEIAIDVALTMPDENVSRVPFGRTRKMETGTSWPRVPL